MPYFVEAAGLGTGLEEHHVVAVHGQAVGAGQPGRPGADHGDALAGGRRALERMFVEAGVVEGVALQLADQHRCAFLGVVAYAGPLAEDFRGADAAQLPPRMFAERIFCAAPWTFSWAMLRMNPGMSISVGQALTQGAS